MRFPAVNKKGLSQPVTAMILLVIPVVLTGGVVMYAYQIIENQVALEILSVKNQHIWVYESGESFAAVQIDNLGGKDVLIDKIQVRGVDVDWSRIYYYRTKLIAVDTLNCPDAHENNWDRFEYTPGNTTSFLRATGDLTLPSGCTLIIYIENPDNIRLGDVGSSVSISVITKNARYDVFCVVDSATTAP